MAPKIKIGGIDSRIINFPRKIMSPWLIFLIFPKSVGDWTYWELTHESIILVFSLILVKLKWSRS